MQRCEKREANEKFKLKIDIPSGDRTYNLPLVCERIRPLGHSSFLEIVCNVAPSGIVDLAFRWLHKRECLSIFVESATLLKKITLIQSCTALLLMDFNPSLLCLANASDIEISIIDTCIDGFLEIEQPYIFPDYQVLYGYIEHSHIYSLITRYYTAI